MRTRGEFGKKFRKNLRREQAEDRQLDYNDRTVREQIERLDNKLGKGVGAEKERKRLKKDLQKKNATA